MQKKIGRNDLCICGSGKKFKKCCIEKISQIPYLRKPSTSVVDHSIPAVSVEAKLLPYPQHPGDTYCSIVGLYAGGKPSEPAHFKSSDFIAGLGFCNQEFRPHFSVQLVGHNDPIEVFADHVIQPDHENHLVGTYNGVVAKLFINGAEVASRKAKGAIFTAPHIHSRWHWNAISMRIWLDELDGDGIKFWQLRDFPDFNTAKLLKDAEGMHVYTDKRLPALAYWVVPAAIAVESSMRIVDKILQLSKTDRDGKTPAERTQLARQTIETCCDNLEAILTADEATEGDVLTFFKDVPAATMLLEPDQVDAWRELEIPDHGRIDFVFKLIDDRYVVMEIESPQRKVFTKKDEFSAEFYHAAEQARTWIRGVAKNPVLAEQALGLNGINSPNGVAVIGWEDELSNHRRKDRWHQNSQRSDVKATTWSFILRRGRNLVKRLGNASISHPGWS